jgi:hypothetical protein
MEFNSDFHLTPLFGIRFFLNLQPDPHNRPEGKLKAASL